MAYKIEMTEDRVLFCDGLPCDVDVNPTHEPCEECLVKVIVDNWNSRRKS